MPQYCCRIKLLMNLNKPIRIEYTGKPFDTKCSMCAKCAFLSPSLCVCMNVCLDVQIYTKLLIKIHGCIIQPVAKPTDKEREREIKYHSIVHVLKMENLTHCSTNTHTYGRQWKNTNSNNSSSSNNKKS